MALTGGPGASGYSEHGEFSFAVGKLTGVRTWNMTPGGGLVGAFGRAWNAGENVAVCPRAETAGPILVVARREIYARWVLDHARARNPRGPEIINVTTLEDAKNAPPHSAWIVPEDWGLSPVRNLSKIIELLVSRFGPPTSIPAMSHRLRMAVDQEIHDVPAPNEICGCGYWCYWTADQAYTAFSPAMPVVGIVDGYGRCRIGERGFRAAKAKIVALWLGFEYDEPDLARREFLLSLTECRLEDIYPGVRMYSTLAAMLENHPPTTPPDGPKSHSPFRSPFTAAGGASHGGSATVSGSGTTVTSASAGGGGGGGGSSYSPGGVGGAGGSGGGSGGPHVIHGSVSSMRVGNGPWWSVSSQGQLTHALSWGLTHHPDGTRRLVPLPSQVWEL